MKLYIITDSISPKAGEWYGTKSNDVYYIDAVDGKYLEVDHYFYAIRDTSPRVQNEEVKKNEFLQEKPFKFASKNEAMKWLKKKHTNDSFRDSNEDVKSAIKNIRLQKGFRISKEGKDALGKKYDYEFISNKTYNSQNEFDSDANKIADYLDSIEDKYGTRITYNAVVGKSDKKAHFNVDFLRMKDSIKDGTPLKKGDIIGFEIKGEKLLYSLWNVSAPSANNVQELNDSTYYFLRKYSDGTYSTEVKKSVSIFVDIDSDKADFSEVDLLRGHGYKIIRFSSKKAGFDWLKQGKKVFDSKLKDVRLEKGDWFILRNSKYLYKVDSVSDVYLHCEIYYVYYDDDKKQFNLRKEGRTPRLLTNKDLKLNAVRFNSAEEALNWLRRQVKIRNTNKTWK